MTVFRLGANVNLMNLMKGLNVSCRNYEIPVFCLLVIYFKLGLQ
jgi:hypothetical protein